MRKLALSTSVISMLYFFWHGAILLFNPDADTGLHYYVMLVSLIAGVGSFIAAEFVGWADRRLNM
jgi:hypothetical protein